MALPTKKSLGQLRAEIRARLGFGAQGSQSGPLTAVLDNFLIDSQEQLYQMFNWKLLKKTWTLPVGINQQFVDYADDMNPDRFLDVRAFGTSAFLYPMEEGISASERNTLLKSAWPVRYELRDQIEVWPLMDSVGSGLRIEGIIRLKSFSLDTDTTTLDDENLIFLHALANAKNHYRQQDAAEIARQLSTQLDRVKTKEAGNRRYKRERYRPVNRVPLSRPVVIDTRFDP